MGRTIFIGDVHGCRDELDVLIDKVGLSGGDRLVFVESTRAIEQYFRAADLYVLPSVREGLSIALLEAMASGLPCIATRLDGSTDGLIEHDVNGMLVEPDDAEGFAESIRTILSDSDRAVRLGCAARETVLERYSIQRTAPSWLSAYRELASASRSDAAVNDPS